MTRFAAAAAVLLLGAASAHGATLAFTGAELYPIAGPPVTDGVLVVENGTIRAAGPAGEVVSDECR